MHIVVALKQVLDPNTPAVQLRISDDGRSLEPLAGMSPVMNGYDANAVEAAVMLKEKHGGSITLLSIGDESVKAALRRAFAMGGDRAVLIAGPTGLAADSAATAALLAAAIRKLAPVDLILAGRQASDTDAGQVPQRLAALLDLPVITPVKGFTIDAAGGATVERIGDGTTQRLKVMLPAVLGVSNEINKPRPAPLKGVMLAKKAEIPTWSAADLGIEPPMPALILRRLSVSPMPESRAELIAAPSAAAAGVALADRLRQEGMI
jgi:electron transfer flavoprotein beta subunit